MASSEGGVPIHSRGCKGGACHASCVIGVSCGQSGCDWTYLFPARHISNTEKRRKGYKVLNAHVLATHPMAPHTAPEAPTVGNGAGPLGEVPMLGDRAAPSDDHLNETKLDGLFDKLKKDTTKIVASRSKAFEDEICDLRRMLKKSEEREASLRGRLERAEGQLEERTRWEASLTGSLQRAEGRFRKMTSSYQELSRSSAEKDSIIQELRAGNSGLEKALRDSAEREASLMGRLTRAEGQLGETVRSNQELSRATSEKDLVIQGLRVDNFGLEKALETIYGISRVEVKKRHPRQCRDGADSDGVSCDSDVWAEANGELKRRKMAGEANKKRAKDAVESHRVREEEARKRVHDMDAEKERLRAEGYPSWVTVFVEHLKEKHGERGYLLAGSADLGKEMKFFLKKLHPDKFVGAPLSRLALLDLQIKDFNKWNDSKAAAIRTTDLVLCVEGCGLRHVESCAFR